MTFDSISFTSPITSKLGFSSFSFFTISECFLALDKTNVFLFLGLLEPKIFEIESAHPSFAKRRFSSSESDLELLKSASGFSSTSLLVTDSFSLSLDSSTLDSVSETTFKFYVYPFIN